MGVIHSEPVKVRLVLDVMFTTTPASIPLTLAVSVETKNPGFVPSCVTFIIFDCPSGAASVTSPERKSASEFSTTLTVTTFPFIEA